MEHFHSIATGTGIVSGLAVLFQAIVFETQQAKRTFELFQELLSPSGDSTIGFTLIRVMSISAHETFGRSRRATATSVGSSRGS